jgi:hypothetical protein
MSLGNSVNTSSLKNSSLNHIGYESNKILVAGESHRTIPVDDGTNKSDGSIIK